MAKKIDENNTWLSVETDEEYVEWHLAQFRDIEMLTSYIRDELNNNKDPIGLMHQLKLSVERYIVLYYKFDREQNTTGDGVCLGTLNEGDEFYLNPLAIYNLYPKEKTRMKQVLEFKDDNDSYAYTKSAMMLPFTTVVYPLKKQK